MRRAIILTAITVILLAFLPTVLRGAWNAGSPPPSQQEPEKTVIRVLAACTWEGDGLTLLTWLQKQAARFESAHNDVLVHVQAVDVGRLSRTFLESRETWPDAVVYPPGGFAFENALQLPGAITENQPRPALAACAGGRAVLLGWQAYQALFNDELCDLHGVSPGAWSSGQWRGNMALMLQPKGREKKPNGGLTLGLDGPGGGAAALVESCDTPTQWAGVLSAGFEPKRTRAEAWQAHVSGRFFGLIGSRRDVMRAEVHAKDRGRAYSCVPLMGTLLYTDMAYYGSATAAGKRQTLDFIGFLASEAQDALPDCGIRPARADLFEVEGNKPLLLAPAHAELEELRAFNAAAVELLAGRMDAAGYMAARERVFGTQ